MPNGVWLSIPGPEPEATHLVLCCDGGFSLPLRHAQGVCLCFVQPALPPLDKVLACGTLSK